MAMTIMRVHCRKKCGGWGERGGGEGWRVRGGGEVECSLSASGCDCVGLAPREGGVQW